MPRQILLMVIALLGAHGLAFFLMRALPSAATLALGLQSGNAAIVSAFEASIPQRSYLETLTDLLKFNLGRTLDGTAVSAELWQASMQSLPIVIVALVLLVLSALIAALFSMSNRTAAAIAFAAFLPPFLFAFLASAFGLFGLSNLEVPALCAAVALPPCCLWASIAQRTMQRELAMPYADTLRGLGLSSTPLRRMLLNDMMIKMTPTLDKAFSSVLAALLFCEPVLGRSGLGTLAARAARRNDVDLVLGVVLVFASFVACARIAAWLAQRYFRIIS